MSYRIGIDCRFYSLHNGIGRYIAELLVELAKQDQDNQYILFFNEDGLKEYQKYQKTTANQEAVLTNAAYYSLSEQTKFLKELNKAKLDLVHFTNFNAPLLYRGKSIVTIHDLTLHFYPGNKLNKPWHRLGYHLIFRRSINRAEKIITVSDYTASDLHKVYPKTASKTQTIHLGVNNDFQKQNYPTPAGVQNQNYLLYAGNWREHKNIANLIRAFSILKEQYNYSGNLVLTGKPRQDHSDIPGLVKELSLTDQIIFLGYIDHAELPNLFHHASAYILPSFYEGFGLPALEAMQTETPVICSETTCLPEVCGNAAIYFDPHSPENMAAQINKALTKPELRQQLIEAGKEQLQKFSYQITATRTLKLYNQILTTS